MRRANTPWRLLWWLQVLLRLLALNKRATADHGWAPLLVERLTYRAC